MVKSFCGSAVKANSASKKTSMNNPFVPFMPEVLPKRPLAVQPARTKLHWRIWGNINCNNATMNRSLNLAAAYFKLLLFAPQLASCFNANAAEKPFAWQQDSAHVTETGEVQWTPNELRFVAVAACASSAPTAQASDLPTGI